MRELAQVDDGGRLVHHATVLESAHCENGWGNHAKGRSHQHRALDDTEYAPLCARVGVPLTLVPERVNAPLAEFSRAAGGNDAKRLRRLLSVALTPFLDELSAAAEGLTHACDEP
jgi:hypothetical protein